MTWAGALTRLALQAVPRHLRESVHGDLLESQAGVGDAWAVAWQFQLEPYRERVDRRAALLLLMAAAGLLWIVPLAAHSLLGQAAAVGGGFARMAHLLWGAPALVAAAACGLFVGRASLLPAHADAARCHLLLLLGPWASAAAVHAWQAAAAVVLMFTAAWFAHLNGQSADDVPAHMAND